MAVSNAIAKTWTLPSRSDNRAYTYMDITAPAAPASPAASVVSSSTLRLTWTTGVDAESTVLSANIYIGTASGGPYTFVISVPVGTNTYDVTGLNANTAYYFKITARNVFDQETLLAACSQVTATTSVGAGGGGGQTNYTATHYVVPFAQVSGATNDQHNLGGVAFDAARVDRVGGPIPTTFGTALGNARAGDKVRLAPGAYIGYITSSLDWLAAFAPTNSGTNGNPIIFFAQYPAAYNTTSPLLLSEVRRTRVAGTNCTIDFRNGSNDTGRTDCIYDGLYLDESVSLSGPNRGSISMTGNVTRCEYRRCWIDRADVAPYGNGFNGAVMYFQGTTDCWVRDCLFTGTSTLTTQQDSCIEIYDSTRLTIRNMETLGAGIGVHVKTELPGTNVLTDDVVVEYGKFNGHGGLVSQTSRGTTFRYNLIIFTGASGIRWTSIANNVYTQTPGFLTRFRSYNNTVLTSGAGAVNLFVVQAFLRVAAGTEAYNNLYRDTSGTACFMVNMPEGVSAWNVNGHTLDDWDRLDYNFYVDASGPRFRLVASGGVTTHSVFTNYQNAMAAGYNLDAYGFEHEQHSQHGTVSFINEGAGNYRLTANGQAALTASVTGGPVGCYGTEEIGLRASPTY